MAVRQPDFIPVLPVESFVVEMRGVARVWGKGGNRRYDQAAGKNYISVETDDG